MESPYREQNCAGNESKTPYPKQARLPVPIAKVSMRVVGDEILSSGCGQSFDLLMASRTGRSAIGDRQQGLGICRPTYIVGTVAVAALCDTHTAELLYLTVVRLPIGSIQVLVAGTTLTDDVPHKIRRIDMRDGMRRMAIAAKGRPNCRIVSTRYFCVNRGLELFPDFCVTPSTGVRDIQTVYSRARIFDGQDLVVAMTIFTGGSYFCSTWLAPAMNTVLIRSYQHAPIFQARHRL